MRVTGPLTNLHHRSRGKVLLAVLLALVAAGWLVSNTAWAEENGPGRRTLRVDVPMFVFPDVPIDHLSVDVLNADGEVDETFSGDVTITGLRSGDEPVETLTLEKGTVRLESGPNGDQYYVAKEFAVEFAGETTSHLVRHSAGLWRLLPPIVAIGLAIWLKDVYIALFAGLYSGCLLLAGGNPWIAFLNMFNGDKHGVSFVLADAWNMQVLIFTLFLGAMVQIMSDSGGTRAVVQRLSGVTTTRERGQLLTWFAGLLIFFDDYANTMLVGNSMRPVTDRLRISREKLAFLIDSTAAPIAGLAIVSTWVGVELGAIKDGLASLATDEAMQNQIPALKDQIFMGSIPYRFYPIFLIGFVMLIAATGRDYGAMLRAEQDAMEGDGPKADDRTEEAKSSIWYAIAPVGVLVVWIGIGFIRDYGGQDFDSVPLLLQASFFAALTALVMAVAGKALTLNKAADAGMKGMVEMFPALVVLVLAWGISSICKGEGLATANYIVEQLGDRLSLKLLPTISFIISGAIAFAVGSSYATMGLVIPLFIALVGEMLKAQGVAEFEAVAAADSMLATVGAILAGSIFGDHCSPISDTTVLSSAGAQCNHLRHVATQLPYALTVGGVAIVCGYLPAGYGMSPWLMLPVGFVACLVVVLAFGRRAEQAT